MRLDGALEPHHGAPATIAGSSIGVQKRRALRHCDIETHCDAGLGLLGCTNQQFKCCNNNKMNKNNNNNNNHKNNNNNNNNNNNSINNKPSNSSKNSCVNSCGRSTITEFISEGTGNYKAPKLLRVSHRTFEMKIEGKLLSGDCPVGKQPCEPFPIVNSQSKIHSATTTDEEIALNIKMQGNYTQRAISSGASYEVKGNCKSAIANAYNAAPLWNAMNLPLKRFTSSDNPLKTIAIGVSTFVNTFKNAKATIPIGTIMVFVLCVIGSIPIGVYGDDADNFFAVNSFSVGPETTTPEFDYVSRGKKKFGDKCDNTLECGFPGSICDPKKKSCQCTEDLPVTNHIDKCGKEAAVNESCFFHEQCESKYFQTECRDGRCICRFEMMPIWNKDGSVECKARQEKRGPETYIDPAMIGVLVGMALMFVIICVVLRLFSQARWRENRTIFNTPNPRLMNVSLLRDSKLLHGQERRGSRMSVRAPSRQPSMASLRPHSPNPSLGKTGSRSGSGSNASATSLRSNRSNSVAPGHVVNISSGHHERKGSAHHQRDHGHHQHQHHHQQPTATHQHHQQELEHEQEALVTNTTANPASENVTVEIVSPAK